MQIVTTEYGFRPGMTLKHRPIPYSFSGARCIEANEGRTTLCTDRAS